MKRYPGIFIITSVALATLALSVPASAGQRERRSTQSQESRQGTAAERRTGPQQRQAQPQPQLQQRQVQPQQRQVQPQPRQVQPQPRQFQPQTRQIQPRLSERQIAPERRGVQAPRNEFQGRAIPRPQGFAPQRNSGFDRDGRFDNRNGGFGRSFGPSRFAILPRGHEYFSRYYSFRPRLSLGLGLYLGYPVPFPRWYDSYWYSNYGYNFSTAPYGGYNSVGGLSFDIAQSDAELWIDGEYVGFADDFSPSEPPLTLSIGLHHVELSAPGYRPMEFDITVVPGQVIPYQGTLSR